MTRSSLAISLMLIAFCCVAWSQVYEEQTTEPFPTGDRPFNFWMEVKLEESQKIFAAMAEGDYEAILKSSGVLTSLNKIERFVRKKPDGYHTQLRAFEFAVNEMKTHAEAENLEGVVLGFHQLTLSCVNCHKRLRTPIADPGGNVSTR